MGACATEGDEGFDDSFDDPLHEQDLDGGKDDSAQCRSGQELTASIGLIQGAAAQQGCSIPPYREGWVAWQTTGSLQSGWDSREMHGELRAGQVCKDNCFYSSAKPVKLGDGTFSFRVDTGVIVKSSLPYPSPWEMGMYMTAYAPAVKGPGIYKGYGVLRSRQTWDGVKEHVGLEYKPSSTLLRNCTFKLAVDSRTFETTGTFECSFEHPHRRGDLQPYYAGIDKPMTIKGSFSATDRVAYRPFFALP